MGAPTVGLPVSVAIANAGMSFWGLDSAEGTSGSLAYVLNGKARLEDHQNGGSKREMQVASVINLDGVGDFVTVADHADFNTTTALSASIWAKNDASDVTSTEYLIGKWNATGDKKEWLLGISDAEKVNVFLSGDGSTTNTWTSDSAVTTDEWAEYGFTYDGSSLKVFRNGQEIAGSFTSGSLPSALHNDTADVNFGATNAGGAGFWAGSLSDARIYTATLTDSEMEELGTWPDMYTATESGLVGHWTCTDQNGLVVQNRESNAKHGTITVNSSLGTIRATDKTCPSADWPNVHGFTGARRFDGSSEIDMGDVLDLGTDDVTLSAWVLTSEATNRAIVGKANTTASTARYAMLLVSGKLYAFIDDGPGGAIDATSSASVNDGEWHHVAATFDRDGNLTLYVDGSADGSDDISSISASDIQSSLSFMVGGHNASTTWRWIGHIKDVRRYTEVVSPANIALLAAGTDYRTNLNGQWLFDEEYTSASATVIDESTNNNHGTPTGTSVSRIPVGTTADTDIRGLTSQHTGKVPRSPIANSPVITLDGVGDYASVNFGARGTSYPQTLRGSFYADTVAAGVDAICTINDESVDNLYWGIQRSGSNLQVLRRNTTEVATTTGPALSATTWYDYVLRLDSATAFTLWIRTHGGGVRQYTKTGLTSVALSTSIDAIAIGTKSLTTPSAFWAGRQSNIVHHDGTAMSDAQAESLLDDPKAVAGAVGLWRAVEGGGDVVHDELNENHATITVNSSLATIWGQTGPADLSIINGGCSLATYYDGASTYGIATADIFSGATKISGAARFRTTLTGTAILWGEKQSTTSDRICEMSFVSGDLTVHISDDGTTGGKLYKLSGYNDGDWHTVAFSWDGGANTLTIYVDGSDVTSSATKTADENIAQAHTASVHFRIGGQNSTPATFYTGHVREAILASGFAWTAQELSDYTGSGTLPADYTHRFRDGTGTDHVSDSDLLTATGTPVLTIVPGTVAADTATHLDKIIAGQTLSEDAGVANSYWGDHLATSLADVTYAAGDDDEADVRFVRTQSLGTPTTQPENDDRLIYTQPAATGAQLTTLEDYTS